MQKCKNCLSKCEGCIRIESGHARYCDFADPDHPDYNPAVLPIFDQWCAGKPDAPSAATQGEPKRKYDPSLDRAIIRCPHRTPPSCGCPEYSSTCTHPAIGGEVWLPDCVRNQRSGRCSG